MMEVKRIGATILDFVTDPLRLRAINSKLKDIQKKLFWMDYFSNGGRAVYVGNNRVLVKCIIAGAQVAYYVEADDRLLAPWFIVSGAYETELTSFFVASLKPDSHCIDVGSNFGYFTCLMARFCPSGKIIGIEPDLHVMQLARDNVLINGFHETTEVMLAAASDHEGQISLHRRKTRSGNTSITKASAEFLEILGEAESEEFSVKAVRIDSLLEKMNGRVDFIKIDVEGAEPLAMRGAQQTIALNPQLQIVMEWSPGQISGAGFDVHEFLRDLERQGLVCAQLTASEPKVISFVELEHIPYAAGILLRRKP